MFKFLMGHQPYAVFLNLLLQTANTHGHHKKFPMAPSYQLSSWCSSKTFELSWMLPFWIALGCTIADGRAGQSYHIIRAPCCNHCNFGKYCSSVLFLAKKDTDFHWGMFIILKHVVLNDILIDSSQLPPNETKHYQVKGWLLDISISLMVYLNLFLWFQWE